MDNHWIALYLSGQYPGKYIVPNKLDIIFKIRQVDVGNFGDPIIGLLQGKSDIEYFKTLLDVYEWFHGKDKLIELLERLWVPEDTRNDPYKKTEDYCSLQDLNDYLGTVNETDFSRFVVMPLLHAMGYEDIEYKWKVNETDAWIDFYPVKFTSPGWITHYAWIQTKACKMSDWDTSDWGKEFAKLVAETKNAFDAKLILTNWEEINISEYIVLNARQTPESVIKKYYNNKNTENKSIMFYSRDKILSLAEKLKLRKEFYK